MSKVTFLSLAEKVLSAEVRPLTAEEIWDCAVAKGMDREMRTTGKTPWRSISAQIYVDLLRDPVSVFVKTGSRPVRFYLRKLAGQLPADSELPPPEMTARRKLTFKEKDLHCALAYFAFTNLEAYCKTINHSKSGKKEYGEWVHPDMVGCYFPIEAWQPEVIELNAAIGSSAIRLFSFELKRELSFTNLRESFFQAVSNSSWANEGYLAAAEISQNEEFRTELQRLSTSFGIGIIHLDVSDPDASEVMYPAKRRDNLDWESINKLTMNDDFATFLRRIRIDLASKEVRKEMYDDVLDLEELIGKFQGGDQISARRPASRTA